MRTVSLIDMLSRMISSSRRAGLSSSRWNRIEVCRMRSTRSNTSAPSCSRTVSPRMRPSSRISVRSRASSSSAKASSPRLDRRSASEGMIWEDMVGGSRKLPGILQSQFFKPDARPRKRRCCSLNLSPSPLPMRIAQAALEDLAGIFARQAGMDFDVFRHLVVGERGLELRADRRHVERYARLRLDHRHQRLAELFIGDAEHRAIMHAGNRMQRCFDFGGIDVDTTRDHHVTLAVADEDVAVVVDIADIARGNESVAFDLGALLRLVVIGEIRIACHA